ncbi:uncharacterized protein METZ01_LOCUS393922, partial [marine metagenome]
MELGGGSSSREKRVGAPGRNEAALWEGDDPWFWPQRLAFTLFFSASFLCSG